MYGFEASTKSDHKFGNDPTHGLEQPTRGLRVIGAQAKDALETEM